MYKVNEFKHTMNIVAKWEKSKEMSGFMYIECVDYVMIMAW